MLNTEKREASLQNVNLRIQRHGEDRVTAADLKFEFSLGSQDLDSIAPGLKETLYRQPTTGDQMQLGTGPEGWTVLRHPDLEPVRIKGKFPGYELALGLPHQDPANGEWFGLVDVELKKVTVDPKDGGTVVVTVTASMPVDDDEVGEITAFLRAGDVLLTLNPPTATEAPAVAPDATAPAEASLH